MASEWPVVRLGDFCTKIGSGATPRGGKDTYLGSSEFALIRSQNIYNDGFHGNGLAFISSEQAVALSGVAVQVDDVLVNITGDSVARVCQAPAWVLPARVNQHVAIVRPDVNHLDPRFIRYFLNSPVEQERLLSLSSVGATRPALTKGMLEALKIPKPHIEVQREVVAPLVALDDRIDLLRQTNATLEAIAQALFKSWFIDFDPVRAKAAGREPDGMDATTAALFPSEFEESELGLIPKGWHVLPMSDAFHINPRRQIKKGSIAPYLDMASLPTTGHVPNSPINRDFSSGSKFQNGDTLLARITPCLENGKTAHVDILAYDQVGWGSTEFIVLRPKPPLPLFFGYLLARHDAFRTFATQAMSGTSGRQRVELGQLQRFKLVCPDAPIANAFGLVVEPIRACISANRQRAETLSGLRDTLLPRLISGKLRLPEADAKLEDLSA